MKNTSLSLHSAFDRVLNYADEEGRILSLVLPEIGGGPGHVIVDRLPDPAPADIILSDGKLKVGGEWIDLADQPAFDPYLDVREWPSPERIREGVAIVLPMFPSASPVLLLKPDPGGRSATALPACGGFRDGRAGPPDPPEQEVSRAGLVEPGACSARALPARDGFGDGRAGPPDPPEQEVSRAGLVEPGACSARALPARDGFGDGRAGPPDPPEQEVSRAGLVNSGGRSATALPTRDGSVIGRAGPPGHGVASERSRTDFNHALCAELEIGVGYLLAGDAEAGARTLKGLGYGLTPTGDDMLCGFLWALALADRFRGEQFVETRGAILEIARGENLIVNHFLTAARNGLFFERFKYFVEAFMIGDVPRIRSTFAALLDIGETSGADTVIGFMLGLRFVERRGRVDG